MTTAEDKDASPVKRLLEAGNDLIAQGLQACARDNPAMHTSALEFAQAGAFPRLIIDTHPDLTTVDFVLWGQDGEPLRVFQFNLARVESKRH